MKNTKVDFGMRCRKCNHKISEKSQLGKNGNRIATTGLCSTCLDPEEVLIAFALKSGTHQYKFQTEEWLAVGWNTEKLVKNVFVPN